MQTTIKPKRVKIYDPIESTILDTTIGQDNGVDSAQFHYRFLATTPAGAGRPASNETTGQVGFAIRGEEYAQYAASTDKFAFAADYVCQKLNLEKA